VHHHLFISPWLTVANSELHTHIDHMVNSLTVTFFFVLLEEHCTCGPVDVFSTVGFSEVEMLDYLLQVCHC